MQMDNESHRKEIRISRSRHTGTNKGTNSRVDNLPWTVPPCPNERMRQLCFKLTLWNNSQAPVPLCGVVPTKCREATPLTYRMYHQSTRTSMYDCHPRRPEHEAAAVCQIQAVIFTLCTIGGHIVLHPRYSLTSDARQHLPEGISPHYHFHSLETWILENHRLTRTNLISLGNQDSSLGFLWLAAAGTITTERPPRADQFCRQGILEGTEKFIWRACRRFKKISHIGERLQWPPVLPAEGWKGARC
jgi:hypothetical protein